MDENWCNVLLSEWLLSHWILGWSLWEVYRYSLTPTPCLLVCIVIESTLWHLTIAVGFSNFLCGGPLDFSLLGLARPTLRNFANRSMTNWYQDKDLSSTTYQCYHGLWSSMVCPLERSGVQNRQRGILNNYQIAVFGRCYQTYTASSRSPQDPCSAVLIDGFSICVIAI